MIDLKSILNQYPNCLSSRTSFKSVLMDTYPDEKRTVNILTIMFECGIVQKIKSRPMLGDNEFQAVLLQLETDYGIVSEYCSESVEIWAKALDVVVMTTNKQISVPVAHEPIVHAPIVERVIVEGAISDFETKLENGSITITKFIGFDEKEIVVPNQIDGVVVRSIGANAFTKCTGIEKVVVSEGIEQIHDGAFSHCSSLKEVILPTTLQMLGDEPERQANGRRYFRIYSGVFEGCPIENISLPNGLKVIGGRAFKNCKLNTINLPNSVEAICESCFEGCYLLESVLLPDNLKLIDEDAFKGCAIIEIDLPQKVENIFSGAFSGCKCLLRIGLNEGLITMGVSVFQNCPNLTYIVIPRSVDKIEGDIFQITGWYQPYDRRMKGYSTSKKNPNLTIGCYAGSYGLEYARKIGYPIRNAAIKEE